MKKCEVLKDSVIAICKGSIVYVNDRQYELARNILKPIVETTSATTDVVEKAPKKKKATNK